MAVSRFSTYTVLGLCGYVVASIVVSVLATAWDMTWTERVIALFAPPLAFLAVVRVTTLVLGSERIVFYQATMGCLAAVVGSGELLGASTAPLVDTTAIGIGVFLVFGRIGCFSVACCHGTLGRGVTYGDAHVAAGFWHRWHGRSVRPVQLVEAVASAVLVAVALGGAQRPGDAAAIYLTGYALVRFPLELSRGDARPHAFGLSEAQYWSLAVCVGCAIWRPGALSAGAVAVLAISAIYIVATRRARELLMPWHLRELDKAMFADRGRRTTSMGVAVSAYPLPDGRTDWVLSAAHSAWTPRTASALASAMWPDYELVPGRTPDIVHVIAGRDIRARG